MNSSINRETARYIAWLRMEDRGRTWEGLINDAIKYTDRYSHIDESNPHESYFDEDKALLSLKASMDWFEETPFDQEFLRKVEIDDVLDYLMAVANFTDHKWRAEEAMIEEEETELIAASVKRLRKLVEFKKINGQVVEGKSLWEGSLLTQKRAAELARFRNLSTLEQSPEAATSRLSH